jgi:hypothetical protein
MSEGRLAAPGALLAGAWRWLLAVAAAALTFVAAGYLGLFALLLGPFPQDLAEPTAAFTLVFLPVLAGALLAPSHRLAAALVFVLAAAGVSLAVLGLALMPVLGGGAAALAIIVWWVDPRRTRRQTLWAGCGAALAVLVFAGLVAARHLDWPARPDEVPPELAYALADDAAGITAFYGYDLGGFIDREHLWRVVAAPEVMARIIAGLGLLPADEVPPAFWRMPPHDWPDAMPADGRAYASPGFAAEGRGQDGTHHFLVHDRGAGRAYFWVKANF